MTHPAPTKRHHHDPAHDHGPADDHAMHTTSAHPIAPVKPVRSVLAWPAWLRVLAVLPVVMALWLAVWWANAGVATW